MLSSVLADNKCSTNAIIHSMLPLGQNTFAIMVWAVWHIRSANEEKYAFINYVDISQKNFNDKGREKAFYLLIKEKVSFLNRQLKTYYAKCHHGVMYHETSWYINNRLQHSGGKKQTQWSEEKGYTHLSIELWPIFHYSYNHDCLPGAVAIPGLGTGRV